MKYCLLLFFSSLGVSVIAQNIYSSPYSIYGLGIMNYRFSTLNRAMGGAGIAVQDGYNLNYLNPASYSKIKPPISSIFEMGFYMERDRYKTHELSESQTIGNLSNLNYWFKLSPRWSSIVGLTPFSSVSYKVNTTRTLGSINDVQYVYEGRGNISRLYWGNGLNIVKNLSLGVNISYLFGTISRSESISLLHQAANLLYENKVTTNKIHVDAGFQYSILLRKDRSLAIGVVADDKIKFDATEKSFLYNDLFDTLSTTTGNRLQYRVPASFGIGLALQSARSVVAADLKFQRWSEAEVEDENSVVRDTWRFAFGYMRKGNPDAITYWGSMSLRAGLHLENYYLQVRENVLPWWGFTAGISMPMFDNRSSVNITYSFDQVGTLNDGLILQQSQQIMLDIIIRDLWGIRRRFD